MAVFLVYNGTVILDGGYLHQPIGNFTVFINGNFITSNGAKLELFNGNIGNKGTIHICATCCFETSGNWSNANSGIVSGSGSAITNNGNMSNTGSFSSTITWCSDGSDSGMPSTEDCSTGGVVCGIVQLPIELSLFTGYNDDNQNEIIWETISEIDNDYFILMKSFDGINWTELDKIEGTGNSQETIHYQLTDYLIRTNTYYQLFQVDYNGDQSKSKIISVKSPSLHQTQMNIFPNPSSSSVLSITGMNETGEVSIINHTGQLIKHINVNESNAHILQINVSELAKGNYLIEYRNDDQSVVIRKNWILL